MESDFIYSDQFIENLERYIQDDLSIDDRLLFEKELASSKDKKDIAELFEHINLFQDEEKWLVSEVDLAAFVEIKNRVVSKETDEFSKNLKNFRSKELNKFSGKTKTIIWMTAAISIAASLFLFTNIFNPIETDLYSLYEQNNSWDNLSGFQTKGDAENIILINMENAFNNENYTEVLNLTDDLASEQYSSSPEIYLYEGIASMLVDQYSRSEKAFDQLINSDNIDFHKGYWYKVLLNLKQENREKALKILKIIEGQSFLLQSSKGSGVIKENKVINSPFFNRFVCFYKSFYLIYLLLIKLLF